MDKGVITISRENVFLEFIFDGQMYAVISNDIELDEDSDVYIVKEDKIDGVKIIRNIEDDEEYAIIQRELEKMINEYMEDDENGEL